MLQGIASADRRVMSWPRPTLPVVSQIQRVTTKISEAFPGLRHRTQLPMPRAARFATSSVLAAGGSLLATSQARAAEATLAMTPLEEAFTLVAVVGAEFAVLYSLAVYAYRKMSQPDPLLKGARSLEVAPQRFDNLMSYADRVEERLRRLLSDCDARGSVALDELNSEAVEENLVIDVLARFVFQRNFDRGAGCLLRHAFEILEQRDPERASNLAFQRAQTTRCQYVAKTCCSFLRYSSAPQSKTHLMELVETADDRRVAIEALQNLSRVFTVSVLVPFFEGQIFSSGRLDIMKECLSLCARIPTEDATALLARVVLHHSAPDIIEQALNLLVSRDSKIVDLTLMQLFYDNSRPLSLRTSVASLLAERAEDHPMAQLVTDGIDHDSSGANEEEALVLMFLIRLLRGNQDEQVAQGAQTTPEAQSVQVIH